MKLAYETMNDKEKTLIDSILFVNECQHRQRIHEDTPESSEYKRELSLRIQEMREGEAQRLVRMKTMLRGHAYGLYLKSQESIIEEAETHLMCGVFYHNRNEKISKGKWKRIVRSNVQVDVSDLVAFYDHLPRGEYEEIANTHVQGLIRRSKIITRDQAL